MLCILLSLLFNKLTSFNTVSILRVVTGSAITFLQIAFHGWRFGILMILVAISVLQTHVTNGWKKHKWKELFLWKFNFLSHRTRFLVIQVWNGNGSGSVRHIDLPCMLCMDMYRGEALLTFSTYNYINVTIRINIKYISSRKLDLADTKNNAACGLFDFESNHHISC